MGESKLNKKRKSKQSMESNGIIKVNAFNELSHLKSLKTVLFQQNKVKPFETIGSDRPRYVYLKLNFNNN